MNKVAERCSRESNQKFHFASKRLYFEAKAVKVCLYLAAVVPIILTFLPIFSGEDSGKARVILSLISFTITLATEIASSFMATHKEFAILEHQMFEAEITGSTFSKIEYDRETTNEINELAIRKGLPKLKKAKKFPTRNVPQEITDDHSYIYLCRIKAATERFLLSRIFYIYFFVLMFVSIAFLFGSVLASEVQDSSAYLAFIVGFYPLVMPIIKDCLACKKASKKCVKICADIDNFFADGDTSVGRLARFHYYIQNLEFEMLVDRPAVFNVFPFMFRRGINILQEGVTYRFLEALKELKSRSLILKGALKNPTGKGIITKVEYDDAYLDKIAKNKKVVVVNKKTEAKKSEVKKAELPVIEEPVKKPTTTKKTTGETKPTTVKKTTPKKVEVNSDEPVKKTTTTKKTSTTTKASTSTTKKTTK